MNRVMLLLASALVLPVPVATLAAERIEVVERALTDATLDLGAKGDSVGDLLTWGNPIFDAGNKTQIGTDQGYCVRVVVGKSWECTWTTLFKDGQIMVEGPFYDDKDSVFTIIGGTGKYAGARGSMKLHARDAKASSYQFIFELL
ncbi:MAG TPA: allene oxide cyclase family protein [Steroidobacteraceae bacterium]|nr:allene oxide cyclase family protein [Steroidobacteraceae bacterium]